MPSVEVVGRLLMNSDVQKKPILLLVRQYICFFSTIQFVYFGAFSHVSYIV